MGLYTIKEVEIIISRTAPTIYAYMRSDDETRSFFAEHRQKRQKGGYLYDDEAIERLKNRFGVADGVPVGEIENENGDFPLSVPAPSTEIDRLSRENVALSVELEDLKGKYQALQSDFDRVNGQMVELLRQNALKDDEINRLLLIIQEEKQEKKQIMLMLPPPKKTIGERIKALFRQESKQEPS